VQHLRDLAGQSQHVARLVKFISSSERGIAR
jgi:hypothetical protein